MSLACPQFYAAIRGSSLFHRSSITHQHYKCITEADLLRQFYLLSRRDRMLQMKFAVSPSLSIATQGKTVPELTLPCQTSGRSATRVAVCKWCDPSKGRCYGGRRPSNDDSLHSPTVIPPSTLDKPSVTKRYHRRRTTR